MEDAEQGGKSEKNPKLRPHSNGRSRQQFVGNREKYHDC